MNADVDPATGRLSVSPHERDKIRSGQVPESLRDKGFVRLDGTRLPISEALGTPEHLLRAVVTGADGTVRQLEGWLGRELLICLTESIDRRCWLDVHHPSYLPVVAARLIDLGPRPQLAEAILHLPSMLLPELLSTDDSTRSAALESLTREVHDPAGQASARAFGAGPVREWWFALWHAGRPGAGSRLDGLETRGGLWLRSDELATTSLIPCRPATLWQALALLPAAAAAGPADGPATRPE